MIALTPILPLISAIIITFITFNAKKIDKRYIGAIASFTPFVSFLIVVYTFMSFDSAYSIDIFEWIQFEEFYVNIAFYIDNLSLFMALFITFIGTLIHIYSIYYMIEDDSFERFFIYLNLFMSSMLILVLANNPIFMFIGWEGVGVCSYLLISFYYQDSENTKAGNKAFILNRIGDFAFIIAIGLLFVFTSGGSFDFVSIKSSLGSIDIGMLNIIALLFFVGASAKSAQLPLYVWLPDAMAGPTPVSALIHAATMVTAGIYLVSRFSFLYSITTEVGLFIAYIGIATSLLSAIIATRQSDIKKILAYSTISQLGYMFVAIGLGAYSAGLFHMFTHAFFKALLFLSAGAVIVALHHEQNIFKMGGLKNNLKPIYICMLIGTLAISGIFPLSGFFSKDEILLSVFASGHYDIWILCLVVAFLSAYYMFRLVFLVFFATNTHHHTHTVPSMMQYVLYILAFGSIIAGLVGIPSVLGGTNILYHYLSHSLYTVAHHDISHNTELILMLLNTTVALLGIYIAYKKYYKYNGEKTNSIIANKFYVDEIYQVVFVNSLYKLSIYIDKYINNTLITYVVDTTLNIYSYTSKVYTKTQNGQTRYYLFYILVGVSMIFLYLLGVAL